MAQYAELYFAETQQDIPVNKYFMKLPEGLRNKIIKWKLNLKYEEKTTWGVKGAKIQLPMTYTMYREMPIQAKQDLFQKIEKKLRQRDMTHVILPRLINSSPFKQLQECTGNQIKSFFIMQIIYFIAKEKIVDKKLKNIEVIILDGNKKDVNRIIDLIYPYINHLTVLSRTPERFQEKADYIFKDVGLNMQVLSYTKGAISQGDIIIDTHDEDPLMLRFCKKGALYLDIANHPEKTVRLKEANKDVLIREEVLFSKNGEIVNTKKAEMLLTMNQVFTRNQKETLERLKRQNIEIYKLM